MKRYFKVAMEFLAVCFFALLVAIPAMAAEPLNTPLDTEDPVYFYGTYIEYGGKQITLDKKDIYLDGSLSDAICDQYDNVYNDFNDAADAFVNGTEAAPMNVYIAPYVYWVDDPDDTEIRKGIGDDPIPYGRWINCSWLSLNGLNQDPYNVVIAVNRGQGVGAVGNYTMFYINGNGTHVENLTLGNYCSVDLDYPLKPELSRKKRTETVVQAQLVLTNGDKITAKNANFISRLNACPFVGADKRILFEECHFECTDDSLPGTAVYLNCDFDFYAPRPFYSTSGTGAVFLNCVFNEKTGSSQCFTKAGGIVTVIDSAFNLNKADQYIGWQDGTPATSLRCNQSNITVNYDGNSSAYTIGTKDAYTTVDLTGDDALTAYRVVVDGQVVYNTYNLLKGSDDWDPCGVKDKILAAGEADGKDYTSVPVQLLASSTARSMVTGSTATLGYTGKFFLNNSGTFADKVTWYVEDSIKDYVKITKQDNSNCTISVTNTGKTNVSGMVYAIGASGLESGCYVTVAPKKSAAPTFVKTPSISGPKDGSVTLNYTLSNAATEEDISLISWYRCSDANGQDAIQTGISRNDTPMQTYTLTYGDVGYYLMAKITPKQLGSSSGTAQTVIMKKRITLADVMTYNLTTDFSNMPIANQKLILPGFWTLCCFDPGDYKKNVAIKDTVTAWTYGVGDSGGGAKELTGLMTAGKGARLVYTPASGTYGDMSVTYVISPEKTAGQLMSSAGYYMEFYIKYDTTTKTGYGVRFDRVQNDGTDNENLNNTYAQYADKTVTATLYKYEDGVGTPISEPILTSAVNTTCTITLTVENNLLSLDVTTTHSQSEAQAAVGAVHEIHTSVDIESNTYGGYGIQHCGSTDAKVRVMINSVSATWEQEQVALDTFKTYNLGHEIKQEDTSSKNQTKTKIALSKCTVSGIGTKYYTGKALTQKLVVKYGSKTLTLNKDYTVAYKNNKNIGTATITITGKGNYTGTVNKTFKISVKKGAKYTVGNYKYQITNASTNGKGTVTLIATTKKTLTSIVVGDTVKIGGKTYKVTAIGAKAFYNNTKITKVTIGKNVTTIGKSAFQSCKKLKTVIIKSSVLKKAGANVLKGIAKKATIKVPAKKVKAYSKLLKVTCKK
jgi:hypothetical protein